MTTKAKVSESRPTAAPVASRAGRGQAAAEVAGRPDKLRNADDVLALQRSAGNQATTAALAQDRAAAPVQRSPEGDSVKAALHSVTVVSSQTTQVASLQPWVIFETLPWNPSDGKKKTLFGALKKAHGRLGKAQAALAEAQKREAALAEAQKRAAAAPPAKSAPPKKKSKAKKVLTVEDAQKAVDKAQADVDSGTKALKEYVKGKLDTTRNPKMAGVRAQVARAKSDLTVIGKALRQAKKAKKPTEALTKQHEEAAAAVTKANDQVKAKLSELRAEIDAADWGTHQVGQTRAVYEVDGARASLYNRVEAYATVTGAGFEGRSERVGGGGPTVAELLGKDPTIGPSTRKILAIISRFEGDFTSVNTWDIADVTFGMVQWTTGAKGNGDLITALTIMKQAAPAAFARRLTRYGIDVSPEGLVLTRGDGTVLTGVTAAKAIQTDPKLTAVLSTAGTDPELQAGELRAANEFEVLRPLRAKVSLTIPGTEKDAKPVTVKVPLSALITSEFGVGVLANHTVHGGLPLSDLQRAANAYVAGHPGLDAKKLETWGPQAEDGLVKAISKGSDAKRITTMRKELDTAAGTFH